MKRVALITGGTRGIGLGIADSLAAEGLDLVLCGRRDANAVQDAVKQVEALGATVLYCRCDVGSAAERAAMLDATKQTFGRLDVLVNNAGMAPRERRDILDASEASYEEVMRTNLQGPYFLTQEAARWMIDQSRADEAYSACVVNIGSISATMASIARGEYCVSKAGMSMATQLWAVRLAPEGISVFEVRPGVTETDMTTGVKEKYDRLIAEGLTLQPRWGTPADVGRAVAMLVRGDLPYSTGQVIMVDGGMTIDKL